VHALAEPAEDDPLGSEDRSDTLDVVLTARFTAALFTALVDEPLIARKLPLASDTSAKPTARDKTPSQIRRRLRADEFTDALGSDDPEAMPRGSRVSMR